MADTTPRTGLPKSRGAFLAHCGSGKRLKITRTACEAAARASYVLESARGTRGDLGLSCGWDIPPHPAKFALASPLVQCK